MMQNRGHLLGQSLVDSLHRPLERLGDILVIGHDTLQSFIGQGADQVMRPRTLGLARGAENLIEKTWLCGCWWGDCGGCGRRCLFDCTHDLASSAAASGALSPKADDSFFRSSEFCST